MAKVDDDIALAEFYKTYSKKEFDRVFEQDECAFAEYDSEFLGFLSQYYYLSKLIPKHWTIVDLGCANGFQAEFFKKHKRYIGVDLHYEGTVFYNTENSTYYGELIKKFLESDEFKKLDLETTFAICNYVPDANEVKMARKHFENIFVYYPSGFDDILPTPAK